VTVRTKSGRAITFIVQRSKSYLNEDFPAQRVYARQGAARLNLVTCTGIYDSTRGGYQSNLVVYTRRVSG
jgi:sortase A